MVVHILCDAIELYLHVCSRVIYRSLTQATIIHACVGSIGWGRSRNLHKGPHKRECFGKWIIFNENQHANYDMINNFQQSRRQRCRSFKKAKLGRGGGGGGLQHELE